MDITTGYTNDPRIPFPQANNLSHVALVPVLVSERVSRSTAATIARSLRLDERQGAYYSDAAVWLGLLIKRGLTYTLSKDGEAYVAMSPVERAVWLTGRVARTPGITTALTDREAVTKALVESGLSEPVASRRSGTFAAWGRAIVDGDLFEAAQ